MPKNYVTLPEQMVRALRDTAQGRELLTEYRKAENFIRQAAKELGYKEDASRVSVKMYDILSTHELPTRYVGQAKVPYDAQEKAAIKEQLERMHKITQYGRAADTPSSKLRELLRNYGVVLTPYGAGTEMEINIDLRKKYKNEAKKVAKKVEKAAKESGRGWTDKQITEVIQEVIPDVEVVNDDRSLRRHTKRLKRFGKQYDPSLFRNGAQDKGWSLNNMVENYTKVIDRIAAEAGVDGQVIKDRFDKAASNNPFFGVDFLIWSKNLKNTQESIYEKLWDSDNEVSGGWSVVIRNLDEFLGNYDTD